MLAQPLDVHVDARGVVTVTLNRPEVNNAYDAAMLTRMHEALDDLAELPGARVLVLRGAGKHFQAGADLGWLQAVRAGNRAENLEASRLTGSAVDRLNRVSVPVVCAVQGACFGGGTGLPAASDVVLAADSTVFSIAEVRWGLQASVIIPQLNDAMSARQVRRYALTAERFDAHEARRIGLVHEVVPLADLDDRTEQVVGSLLQNGPEAVARTKAHVRDHAWGGFDSETFEQLVSSHAQTRQGDEAGEGLRSFLDRRPAAWLPRAE